jgi:RimJ/RimL family protein N-acetyltransferase
MIPTLHTERLTLRPRRAEDADRLVALIGDYEVSGMLAMVPHPYTVADAQAWLSGALDGEGNIDFVIDRGAGLEGVVSLMHVDARTRSFGFWLGRPYWQQGVMGEATRAVIDWAFRETGIARIDSEAYLDNPGSLAIHRRIGFRETGRTLSFSRARDGEVAAATFTLMREDRNADP